MKNNNLLQPQSTKSDVAGNTRGRQMMQVFNNLWVSFFGRKTKACCKIQAKTSLETSRSGSTTTYHTYRIEDNHNLLCNEGLLPTFQKFKIIWLR